MTSGNVESERWKSTKVLANIIFEKVRSRGSAESKKLHEIEANFDVNSLILESEKYFESKQGQDCLGFLYLAYVMAIFRCTLSVGIKVTSPNALYYVVFLLSPALKKPENKDFDHDDYCLFAERVFYCFFYGFDGETTSDIAMNTLKPYINSVNFAHDENNDSLRNKIVREIQMSKFPLTVQQKKGTEFLGKVCYKFEVIID